MSTFLADIDVTCATLGYFDGQNYYEDAGILQNLKHLLWILHNDNSNHDFLRHIAKTNVLQTDLIPLLCKNPDDEVFQALIRLLIVLTNPISILYKDGLPKDGVTRSVFLELVDFMTKYKEAFVADSPWVNLALKLHKTLETDTMIRGDEADMMIERILVLIRNVLQIPTNISMELDIENGPTTHDQVVWVLLQSGMLDLILYILNSADEHRFHLHALEIVVLVLKEQTASSLASISKQRSTPEKSRNEEELVAIRCEEKQKVKTANPRSARHPRFGGTYVFQNMKSVSENNMIYHQPLERSTTANFDKDKIKRRTPRRVEEIPQNEHRSVYSIRLLLREFCTEVLRSAYNTLVRKIRNLLERDAARGNNDDSYLLWTITFFMEFNRLSGLPFELVSESMSVQCFHWVLTEMQHHMDMMESDKEKEKIWARRLNVAVRTFKEMLLSMIALQKMKVEKASSLFILLLNNICGTIEYRESLLQILLMYKPTKHTKMFLQDSIETIYYFTKILKCSKPSEHKEARRNKAVEKVWSEIEPLVSNLLESTFEEEYAHIGDMIFDKEHDVKGDKCVKKIYSLLHQGNYKEAISIIRLAKENWPENKYFNPALYELTLLRDIFASNPRAGRRSGAEGTSLYDDYLKRFVNPKVVRNCIIILSDWKVIKTVVLKSAVALLHSIVTISNCPTMLYQASLFRIFQQALHSTRTDHNMELQRLGIFIVRNFVEASKTNPKIFAELLFYKNIAECMSIESNYSGDNPKTDWTPSEETELRELVERHETDQHNEDVIEWLTQNISDKSKDRYAVMDKLTDMNIRFGKAKRKSKAKKSSTWTVEEDEKLMSLFEEHKTDEDNFSIITEGFDGLKSKDDVMQRINFLQSSRDEPTTAPPPRRKTYEISEEQAELLLCVVSKNFEDVIEWLKESLTEASDVLNNSFEDEDDIPLVPINQTQSAALVDEDFKNLLLNFGVQPPSNSERFWRIPRMSSTEFERRIKIIEDFNSGCKRQPVEKENETGNDTDESDNEVSIGFKRSGTKRVQQFESDDEISEQNSSPKRQKITDENIHSPSSS